MIRTKFIENRDVIAIRPHTNTLSGFFDIEVYQGDILVRKYHIDNIITNQGLERFGGYSPREHGRIADLSFCWLGDGTTFATADDIQLENPRTISSYREYGTSQEAYAHPDNPYCAMTTYTYVFPTSTAIGSFTEIGVGSPFPDTLFSRATITDFESNVVRPIFVSSTESLKIYYNLVQCPYLEDTPFEINLGESQHQGIIRAAMCRSLTYWCPADDIAGPGNGTEPIKAYSGNLGSYTSAPGGIAKPGETPYITGDYQPGSFQRMVFGRFKNDQGNFAGGIKSILVNSRRNAYASIGGAFQLSFDPPIPKDEFKELRLYWYIQWARCHLDPDPIIIPPTPTPTVTVTETPTPTSSGVTTPAPTPTSTSAGEGWVFWANIFSPGGIFHCQGSWMSNYYPNEAAAIAAHAAAFAQPMSVSVTGMLASINGYQFSHKAGAMCHASPAAVSLGAPFRMW